MSEPGAEAWVTTEGFRVEPALRPLRGRERSRSLRPRQAAMGLGPALALGRRSVRCPCVPPRASVSQASVTCSLQRPR